MSLAIRTIRQFGPKLLPFADAASEGLPLAKLLRLSLFQVTVGMALVLVIGTLNRVMIVELHVRAGFVAAMVALPLLFAPARALVGFRSDTHRSMLGWRRVPYIWLGTLLQFGGLAIMPFALIVLSGDTTAPEIVGQIAAAFAFLLLGAGLHTTQTVGLALATDLAPPEQHPRVVALMCVMLLVGMAGSALLFGVLLADFSEMRLISVIQGSGVVTMIVNVIALWKQEPRDPSRNRDAERPDFRVAWRGISGGGSTRRFAAIAIGTIAFGMQDILLEPYGGQVLHLAVGATTALTAMLALGGIAAFALGAKIRGDVLDPYRLAAIATLAGIAAFTLVILAAPLQSAYAFAAGVGLIGFGAGLFAFSTLTAAMEWARGQQTGLILGAWGAVQATAAGIAIACGGAIHDVVSRLAATGALGDALSGSETGYGVVYATEIVLLFATLVALGPLVRAGAPLPITASLRT